MDLLADIRVIDFTHVHAGPLCTYQLALMGATVTKIEQPGSGDQMRQMGHQSAPGMSAGFAGQNANKRSLAIDLKQEEGLRIVHQLIAKADVIVVNMRPGTPDRIGIGYETAKKLNPRIVYCAISGYGTTGPECDRPAMDHLMQGESGMINATGSLETPARVGFAIADSSTAMVAVSSILSTLYNREKTGEGAILDVSMLESCMAVMGLHYYNFLATGTTGPRVGMNPLATIGSAGTWQTTDGYLLVNANNQRLFKRMATAVGRSDLVDDPRFATLQANTQNGETLREIFGSIFATNTTEHWDQVLREAGVPSGQLKTPKETIQHPQLKHRKTLGVIQDVPGFDEPLQFLGAGFTVNGKPKTPTQAPPLLGQHSTEILRDLSLSESQIQSLIENEVVEQSTAYTPDGD